MASSENFKNLANGLAAIAVPIVVAVLGSFYTSAAKEREVSAKFVELAVGILAQEPDKTDAGVRRWATKVLDRYSGVEFDTETRNDIVNRVPLPSLVDTPLSGGSQAVTGERRITRVIIKDTQEPDIAKELAGLKFGNVAYHYLIETNGVVHRLKDENEIAFHTACCNRDSIGIGMSHVSGSGAYSSEQIASLAHLVADIAARRKLDRSAFLATSDVEPKRRSDFANERNAILGLAFRPSAGATSR